MQSEATLWSNLPPNIGLFPFLDYMTGKTTTTVDPLNTTTKPPNLFNKANWQTDNAGNIFIGTDDNKLFLITTGSIWPFPVEYPMR
ncbi:unnamed protein product, partial [Mesorhabditis belari]|uniref:Uncharacterized protein n=1 Tax=Mesorhabditis belari TaxID=2138241 RepID=A0A915FJA2_9BILA